VGFTFRDDITRSDVAFDADGQTLSELLVSAWGAVLAVLVEHPHEIETRETRSFRLTAPDPQALLYDLLERQLYYKDSEGLVLRLDPPHLVSQERSIRCEASARGQRVAGSRLSLGTDVKAVTWYRFAVARTDGQWRATVVLDV